MADDLQKLATEWRGELRKKNLAGRVLADFKVIQTLRSQKCPWHRIAASMGVNHDSLRKLFLWTEKRVAAGTLEPPDPTPASATKRSGSSGKSPARPAGATGEIDPDSGFRTPATPQKEEADDDHSGCEFPLAQL